MKNKRFDDSFQLVEQFTLSNCNNLIIKDLNHFSTVCKLNLFLTRLIVEWHNSKFASEKEEYDREQKYNLDSTFKIHIFCSVRKHLQRGDYFKG
jgi:hypothetical protein